MQITFSTLGLLVLQICHQSRASTPESSLGGTDDALLERPHFDHIMCYEYVQVITYVIGVTSTSSDEYVTMPEAYSGTSLIVGPETVTIPPHGDQPGTVIIQTPAASLPSRSLVAQDVTVTRVYTGTSVLTAPITTTLYRAGQAPEVIIYKAAASLVPPSSDMTESSLPSDTSTTVSTPAVVTIAPITETLAATTETLAATTETLAATTKTLAGTTETLAATTKTLAATTKTLAATTKTLAATTETLVAITETLAATTETLPATTETLAATTETLPPDTVTIAPPSATVADPPGPTFACDAGGFLIQRDTLYRLNLATGDNPIVKNHVGPKGNINALGYNILDNFLYAFISIGNSEQQLIRIDAVGDSILLPLIVPNGLNVGDIDDNGQFWVSARGTRWAQIDLNPSSPTFSQIVAEGKTSGTAVADWAYLENGGDYLYSIRLGDSATAVRWSRTTHLWEVVDDYGQPQGGHSGFGALYAVGDQLWGSDNQTGDIIAFPVLAQGGTSRKISDGPITDSNDGARCFRAPPPEASPE